MSRPRKEGNLIEITCVQCGCKIIRYKSVIENRKTLCCSTKCSGDYKRGRKKNNK